MTTTSPEPLRRIYISLPPITEAEAAAYQAAQLISGREERREAVRLAVKPWRERVKAIQYLDDDGTSFPLVISWDQARCSFSQWGRGYAVSLSDEMIQYARDRRDARQEIWGLVNVSGDAAAECFLGAGSLA
jgi:hypothetical protein